MRNLIIPISLTVGSLGGFALFKLATEASVPATKTWRAAFVIVSICAVISGVAGAITGAVELYNKLPEIIDIIAGQGRNNDVIAKSPSRDSELPANKSVKRETPSSSSPPISLPSRPEPRGGMAAAERYCIDINGRKICE